MPSYQARGKRARLMTNVSSPGHLHVIEIGAEAAA